MGSTKRRSKFQRGHSDLPIARIEYTQSAQINRAGKAFWLAVQKVCNLFLKLLSVSQSRSCPLTVDSLVANILKTVNFEVQGETKKCIDKI